MDAMLGSLARWLRIGGYDTEYERDCADDSLLVLAESKDRVLVTRDEVLAERAKKRVSSTFFSSPDRMRRLWRG